MKSEGASWTKMQLCTSVLIPVSLQRQNDQAKAANIVDHSNVFQSRHMAQNLQPMRQLRTTSEMHIYCCSGKDTSHFGRGTEVRPTLL